MRTRILILTLSAVLVVGVIGLAVSGRGSPVKVITATATTGAINRQTLATGTLEPARMVEVGVQVSGTIAELPVDFNSMVKTGQVVAPWILGASHNSRAARGQFAQAQADASQKQTVLDDVTTKMTRAGGWGRRA
jgi:HlyD family secretion protein